MQPFYTAFYDRLSSTYKAVAQSLEGLPPEALDWIPASGMSTISVLVAHLSGAGKFLVTIAAGTPVDRDRAAEFAISGATAADLTALLDESLSTAKTALSTMTLQNLDENRPGPHGGEVSVGFALLHALDHAAEHLGQLQITRQLWDQQQNS